MRYCWQLAPFPEVGRAFLTPSAGPAIRSAAGSFAPGVALLWEQILPCTCWARSDRGEDVAAAAGWVQETAADLPWTFSLFFLVWVAWFLFHILVACFGGFWDTDEALDDLDYTIRCLERVGCRYYGGTDAWE